MQLIYQRGGNVNNSKFDISLLKPIEDQNITFENQLKPIEENQDDAVNYLDNLPKQPGFLSKLPRNILIGLAKGGHNTLNTPHNLANSIEKEMKDFSNEMQKGINPKYLPKYKHINISDYIPKQQDYDFPSLLGQKGEGTLMDKLIQGGIEYLPEIIAGRNLLRAATRRLTGTHQLESVQNAASKYGQNNFSYSPDVIQEARRYLPNTEATRQLFIRSNQGEYPASFAMRSQLGKHQRNLANSPLASERLLAPEIGDLRTNMLNQLDQGLRNQGMDAEADMLKNGIHNYAQYMRVKEAVMPIIKKLGIPTTAAAAVLFGYKKGKNMLKD